MSEDLTRYLTENDARIRAELFDLLRIPSVSARSEHKGDMTRTAEWVRDSLSELGFETKIHQTKGHPIVVGEWRKAPGAPTVLVYGHYDVQPPEPLELWTSPPFEPTIRDGKIFARGSVDDKGQFFLHIKAVEAHLKTRGKLPVNMVFLIEGEEEIGSEHLAEFVDKQRDLLKADAV
ncbi:MAG: M20/M25/M40 family metallo-hydrolase, partial [Gemmatimonadaceae bacterium]|nr:M20/M25/M40 family metallo-hydrolase [Gemmatimonadaceae bacterium]